MKTQLQNFAHSTRRFEHVHIDLVGPLPESKGFKCLLTVVDRFTRWPEATPISNIEARTVVSAYVQNWVARFGVPVQMTSDRGTQFISKLWKSMSNLLGTELHPTTAYHPQSNCLVERLHRTLKAALKAWLSWHNWVDELPWVMLGLRTIPKEDINASLAELIYETPLSVPGDFVQDTQEEPIRDHLQNLRERVGSLRPVPTNHHGTIKPRVPKSLGTAKFVFVRREAKQGPLQTPYTGPYK